MSIHRLPAVIHLLADGASLFVLASITACNVICIIIHNAMKTTHPISTANQGMNRIRLTMMVVGIVIAVICSLALLYDVQPMENNPGSVNGMIETSGMAVLDFSLHLVSKTTAFVLWPF